jgi:hypothetical protein
LNYVESTVVVAVALPSQAVTAAQVVLAAQAVQVEVDVLRALWMSNVTAVQVQLARLVETTWA